MTKNKPALAAPTYFIAGMDDGIAANLRVVDAATADVIPAVIEADAATSKVRRYETVDGNLVRDGDNFVVVEEDRAIRIEWIVAPDPGDDLSDRTIAELTEIAATEEVDLTGVTIKADIIDTIRASRTAKAENV